MTYREKTLSSGRTVHIRPRTYEEWEKQEEERLKVYESISDNTTGASELAMQRGGLHLRNIRLAAWVKDFDAVKPGLTLRDVAEIEKAALALEDVEIPLGNSESGGDGQ